MKVYLNFSGNQIYNSVKGPYEPVTVNGGLIPIKLKTGDTPLTVKVVPKPDTFLEKSESIMLT